MPIRSPSAVSTFEIRLLDRWGREGDLEGAGEAVVIVDGEDRLAHIGDWANGWIGRWPPEIVGSGSALLPSDDGHDAFVAVCSCGELGCGGLRARITLADDLIVWDHFRIGADSRASEQVLDAEPLAFAASAYIAEVLDPARQLTGWEPTSRQVAAVVVDRLAAQLRRGGSIRFAGAGHIGDESVELAVMVRAPGERLQIKRRFDIGDDESVDASAARIVDYFNSHSFLSDPEATQRKF